MQSGLFIQIIPQALGPAGVAELAQGFGLDLAHPLPGDVELPAQLFQRPGAAILQTEAEGDDPLFPGRQALEHIHQLPAEQLLRRELMNVLKSLTPREERVIALRFGLEDGRARTLEELGREFNVTRERVRQIEAKALRKLRHPSRAKRLRDYLDE